MDMNGFTGVRHKPNLNPDNENIREVNKSKNIINKGISWILGSAFLGVRLAAHVSNG